MTKDEIAQLQKAWEAGRMSFDEIRVLPSGVIHEIESIRRVELRPNDVIVLSYANRLTMIEKVRITESFATAFPNNKVVVLEGGMTFSVVADSDAIPSTLPKNGDPHPDGGFILDNSNDEFVARIKAYLDKPTDQPHIVSGGES